VEHQTHFIWTQESKVKLILEFLQDEAKTALESFYWDLVLNVWWIWEHAPKKLLYDIAINILGNIITSILINIIASIIAK
jgi:hypothetical protein